VVEFKSYASIESSEIECLFTAVFSDSEGEQEGALIGNLAKELIATTDRQNLHGFVAVDGEPVVGAILFSRLTFENNSIDTFILAPVAVRTDYQGKGIGQALIHYGLQELQQKGVSVVITYGDPAFYSKVGFQALSPDVIEPPLELSHPEGWLGQSLTGGAVGPISGACSCVMALDDPAYW
jgi:predicted N-acetyltransferase YhbS